MKQTTKTTIKWMKPTVKTVSLQQLSSTVSASACSEFISLCKNHLR